jgi:hypothetical protein
MGVLVRYAALAVTGSSWQLLAVTGSFPHTSEGSSPNAGMVLAVKVIGSYWQLMAVLVSTLLAVTIIGSYWQLKFLSVTWQLQMHISYWVLGSYNYWHIDTVGSTWQLLVVPGSCPGTFKGSSRMQVLAVTIIGSYCQFLTVCGSSFDTCKGSDMCKDSSLKAGTASYNY